MAGEVTASTSRADNTSVATSATLWLPSADIVDPVWVRYGNRTFMNKGAGPMQQFTSGLAANVVKGDKNYAAMFGSDKSKWIFNTECCATTTYYQHAKCEKY